MRTREIDDPFESVNTTNPRKIPDSVRKELDKLKEENNPNNTISNKILEANSDSTLQTKEATENKEIPNPIKMEAPSEKWIRQDFPSLCIPYKYKEIFVKELNFSALSKLWSAKVNNSLTLLLDTLNSYIHPIDIRDLTPSDFVFFMFWLRENSFKKSSKIVSFESKYGNTSEITVKQSDLEITELKMTQQEYNVWKEKGIRFPTMRDSELIQNSSNVPEDEQWLLEYIQYIKEPDEWTDNSSYVEGKMKMIEKMGTEVYEDITEFVTLLEHGIEESIKIKDPKFDAKKAIVYFKESAESITQNINLIQENTDDNESIHILRLLKLANSLVDEADTMQRKLDRGETVEADEEVVPVSITVTDFFPSFRT